MARLRSSLGGKTKSPDAKSPAMEVAGGIGRSVVFLRRLPVGCQHLLRDAIRPRDDGVLLLTGDDIGRGVALDRCVPFVVAGGNHAHYLVGPYPGIVAARGGFNPHL